MVRTSSIDELDRSILEELNADARRSHRHDRPAPGHLPDDGEHADRADGGERGHPRLRSDPGRRTARLGPVGYDRDPHLQGAAARSGGAARPQPASLRYLRSHGRVRCAGDRPLPGPTGPRPLRQARPAGPATSSGPTHRSCSTGSKRIAGSRCRSDRPSAQSPRRWIPSSGFPAPSGNGRGGGRPTAHARRFAEAPGLAPSMMCLPLAVASAIGTNKMQLSRALYNIHKS